MTATSRKNSLRRRNHSNSVASEMESTTTSHSQAKRRASTFVPPSDSSISSMGSNYVYRSTARKTSVWSKRPSLAKLPSSASNVSSVLMSASESTGSTQLTDQKIDTLIKLRKVQSDLTDTKPLTHLDRTLSSLSSDTVKLPPLGLRRFRNSVLKVTRDNNRTKNSSTYSGTHHKRFSLLVQNVGLTIVSIALYR